MTHKKAIIDRVEEQFAVLRLDDGQELRVNRAELPFGTEEGASVALHITSEDDLEKKHQELAEALLNEIFNKHDSAP